MILMLILGLAFVMLAAACEDGEKGAEETPAGGSPSAEESPAAEGTAAVETPAAGEEPSRDLAEELEQLAEEWSGREAKVTYQFSTKTNGQLEDEGRITLYWRPPDAWRGDFSSSQGDEGTILVTSGKTYFCGGGDGEGQCMSMDRPLGQVIPFPFLVYFTEPGALREFVVEQVTGVDIDTSERSIAGEKAYCFSWAGEVEGERGELEICFSDDGIVLLFAGRGTTTEGQEEFTMEATEVSREVSDADFEPPYPVQDIPFQLPNSGP